MIYKNKTVILVNPISSGRSLISLALEKNFNIILVYTLSNEVLESNAFNLNIQNLQSQAKIVILKEQLSILKSKDFKNKHNVIAVVPASESGVMFAAELANLYQLIGNPVNQIFCSRDKLLMREVLSKNMLTHPKYFKVSTSEEVLFLVNTSLSFPVILKAPSSSGTSQVFLCNNNEEINSAINDIIHIPNVFGEKNSYAILEEFIAGDEYSVNGCVINGRITITDIWKYEQVEKNFFKKVLMLEDLYNKKFIPCIDYITKCIEIMGIKYGMFHAELKIDIHDNPVLIELASRMAGIGMTALLQKVSNFSPAEAHLSAFLGEHSDYQIPDQITFSKHAAMVCYPSKVCGKVIDICGIKDIQHLASYDESSLFFKKGDFLLPTQNLFGLVMTVNMANKDKNQLLNDINLSFELFKIVTDNNQ